MSAITEQDSLVRESLCQFITKNIPEADFNLIDDIVLSYVTSILEEASQDPAFDVEGFIEMMAGYIPEFGKIDAGVVLSWVLELEAELSAGSNETTSNDDSANEDRISLTLQSLTENIPAAVPKTGSRANSECEGSDIAGGEYAVGYKGYKDLQEMFSNSCVMEILQDMFPNTCAMELKHCITIADGDLERAAGTVLHRREIGQSLSPATVVVAARAQAIDDDELKNRIIQRYSYVDKDAENKEHKPLAPKIEPKKMVRYRDNKIVSLRGERYTEVSKSGNEEENLKKPKRQHCP